MSLQLKSNVKLIAHKLRGNVRAEWPKHWIIFDTETRLEEDAQGIRHHRFRLGVAIRVSFYPRVQSPIPEYVRFNDLDRFWNYVDKSIPKRARLILLAHNAEYDFRVAQGFSNLTRRGWRLEKAMLRNRTFLLRWRNGSRTLEVLDSMMLWPMSLRQLGQNIETQKLPMPAWDDPDADWYEYCEQDVEVLYQALLTWRRFLQEHDLGNFKPTLAGQAFAAYRHRFMPYGIYIHDNETVRELERAAYFGGRTECFRLGEFHGGPYFKLDVNSMYPFVMRVFAYPCSLIHYTTEALDFSQELQNSKRFVIAKVKLRTKIPAFPYRHQGRLVFPIGNFTTTLCGAELELAWRWGAVRKVYQVAIYEAAPILRSYVDTLYSLRQRYQQEGNRPYALLTKLLLNSLYGKFGQRTTDWVEVGRDAEDAFWSEREYDPITRTWTQRRCLAGQVYEEAGVHDAFNSFPAIAAGVTSAARVYLWTLIQRAGADHVFYCDTDSLIVDAEGKERLERDIDPQRLGFLKVEEESNSLEIWGLKAYRMSGERKQKGVPPGVTINPDGTYVREVWSRLATAVKRNTVEDYTSELKMFRLSGEYTKGVVLPDGRVQPLRF